jgi:hypothetical protein
MLLTPQCRRSAFALCCFSADLLVLLVNSMACSSASGEWRRLVGPFGASERTDNTMQMRRTGDDSSIKHFHKSIFDLNASAIAAQSCTPASCSHCGDSHTTRPSGIPLLRRMLSHHNCFQPMTYTLHQASR